ncbi:MAG: hypothetical protein JWQ40_3982 [Segetibacter sp.]|jgi:hypothetical protein|nr:hypothetical protein [Segetibacter sp.]
MAKASTGGKKQNKINPENLSQRDVDILTLETKEVMKKYKVEKQAVYDRRFALNKKIKEVGLSVDQLLSTGAKAEPEPKQEQPKKVRQKKAAREKTEAPVEEKLSESRDLMVVNKQVPVIMKPIEINFDNFSIKLNGVPKKISVNPDTNSIEIDL